MHNIFSYLSRIFRTLLSFYHFVCGMQRERIFQPPNFCLTNDELIDNCSTQMSTYCTNVHNNLMLYIGIK